MILSNIFQTMGNKEWIAFADEKKCNHAKSLIKSGFISWVNTANFESRRYSIFVYVKY